MLITATTPDVTLIVAMIVRGMGIGFAFMPAMTAAFAALKRSELSHATPQLNVLQRVGGSIGATMLAVVLERRCWAAPTRRRARPTRYGTAFWWSVGLAALAIIPCVVLMRAERGRTSRETDSHAV